MREGRLRLKRRDFMAAGAGLAAVALAPASSAVAVLPAAGAEAASEPVAALCLIRGALAAKRKRVSSC